VPALSLIETQVMKNSSLFKRFIIAVAVSVGLIAQLPACAADFSGPADPHDTQAALNAFVSGKPGVGIIAGVVNGKTISVYKAGDLGASGPALNEDTVFQIGSVTKTFTATLLALMAMQSEVRLNDPIQRYLPAGVRAPSFAGTPITLLNLAEQNSGLPRLPNNLDPSDRADPYASYSTPMLDDFLSHYSLTRAPGAQYEYSNLGVGLLGDLLANRANEPYAQLVLQRILKPLGMRHTALSLSRQMRALLAPGQTVDGTAQGPWTFGELFAAGAIDSTMRDMLIYLRANMAQTASTRLEKAMAFAQKPRYPTGLNGVMQIGLVWQTNTASRITWHNGETGGYHAFIGFNRAKAFGVVVLSNVADMNVDNVAIHLLAPRAVAAPKPLPPALAVPRATLQRYTGVYQMTPTFQIAISMRGGDLYAQATGQPALRLYPSSPSAFFLRVVDAQIIFQLDAAGNVTGLVLHQNGVDQPARKIQ
jgi:CubicO group peptidase (beta-lactamase class C family)